MNQQTIQDKAFEIASLMKFEQEIDGTSYYYLPNKHHMLHSFDRGFGMKKTIEHKSGRGHKLTALSELFESILSDWTK